MSKHETKIHPQIPPCVNQTTPDDREKGGRVEMKTNLFRHDRTSDEGMDTAAPTAKRERRYGASRSPIQTLAPRNGSDAVQVTRSLIYRRAPGFIMCQVGLVD